MKQLKITLLLVLIVCMLQVGTAAAADAPTVSLNGQTISFDVEPFNDNGHVLVQFRPLIEALGMTVGWEAKSKKITISDGPWPIEIQVGAKSAKVNGESVTLDMPARIVDGVTMVPLRFVSEAAGKRVTWDAQANRVELLQGMDVTTKALQFGGESYDPTNYSFKNGKYATTITQKDGAIYLYWSNEVTYQSASFLRIFVSVYADGRWTAKANQVLSVEKKKGVYYKLAYTGDQIFLRDDVGIRVIPVSTYGTSRPDKHILISPTSSSNELFSVAYYGAKAGVLFGTPDLLGMYFDEDTVIGVQDRHRVLSGQKGNQYVYNPDTKRLNIYNGSAIRQLDVKNGELIYDEQGKDFIIKPVKGSLLSAPAYHSGKMIYVYQTGKRARVAVVDATSLQLESDELTNYYVDSNYKGLTLLPTSDELRLVGLSEYERRPVLKAVVIKNTSK